MRYWAYARLITEGEGELAALAPAAGRHGDYAVAQLQPGSPYALCMVTVADPAPLLADPDVIALPWELELTTDADLERVRAQLALIPRPDLIALLTDAEADAPTLAGRLAAYVRNRYDMDRLRAGGDQ